MVNINYQYDITCLSKNNIDHNYMVGAQLDGFECMVKLSKTSKIAVLEGRVFIFSD